MVMTKITDNVNNFLSGYDGQSASGFSEGDSRNYHSLLYDLGAGKTYMKLTTIIIFKMVKW